MYPRFFWNNLLNMTSSRSPDHLIQDHWAGVTCAVEDRQHRPNYGQTVVVKLKLPSNRLAGTLPTELGLLSTVRNVWLQQNDLGGTLPSELAALSDVNAFYVSKNALTGTIPTECKGVRAALLYLLQRFLPTDHISVLTFCLLVSIFSSGQLAKG